MPYALALAVWQGATLLLDLLVVRPFYPLMAGASVRRTAMPGHDGAQRSMTIILDLLPLLSAVVRPHRTRQHAFSRGPLIGQRLLTLDRRPILSGIHCSGDGLQAAVRHVIPAWCWSRPGLERGSRPRETP